MKPTPEQLEAVAREIGGAVPGCTCTWDKETGFRLNPCVECLWEAEDMFDVIAPMVLEAAACVCDAMTPEYSLADTCADRIRALK